MAILILLAIACVFTVAGGLSAVIYTDTVQERDIGITYKVTILDGENLVPTVPAACGPLLQLPTAQAG